MTERTFRRGTLEVSYDLQNDVLWMANEKQAPRGFDIIKNQVIVFFDHDGTTPTGVMIFDAAELLCPFFYPPEGKVSECSLVVSGEWDNSIADSAIKKFLDPETRHSDSLIVVHKGAGKETVFEKFLKADGLDIFYESGGDTLFLGNGKPAPFGGHDIAEGLIVFFEEEGVPVRIELFDAAGLLVPVLAEATT